MHNHRDEQELAELERLNPELSHSLDSCCELLQECRVKLTARSHLDAEKAEGRYFARRERWEREMSRRAASACVAAAHRQLADRYHALAVVFGAKHAPSP